MKSKARRAYRTLITWISISDFAVLLGPQTSRACPGLRATAKKRPVLIGSAWVLARNCAAVSSGVRKSRRPLIQRLRLHRRSSHLRMTLIPFQLLNVSDTFTDNRCRKWYALGRAGTPLPSQCRVRVLSHLHIRCWDSSGLTLKNVLFSATAAYSGSFLPKPLWCYHSALGFLCCSMGPIDGTCVN